MRGLIKKTLQDFGLSEKETDVYIILGKKGPLKSGEIAKQLKLNKGQVYRKLKSLQKKGVIESTLEYPARYTAVAFEKIIDSFIKSKKEEVDRIEKTKDDLISDWGKIRQIELDSSLERFSVIEGEKKIFNKISQMIKETKKELVSIVSVYGLLRADHYGIFEDVFNHPLKKEIKFRFLTQLTKDNLKTVKKVLGKIGSDLDFKGRDPERSTTITPRMVIRDNEEILLFISDEKDPSSIRNIQATLFTNCRSIIKSFYSVYQELWNQSLPITDRINEIESGKSPSIMELIKDPKISKKKYYDALDKAKKEILIVTSPKRLNEISKNIDLIRKWCKNGVSTRIMAPITSENLNATQKLLSCSEVRHIPMGYRETTIIDENTLFQFNKPCPSGFDDCELLNLENVFYTNDTNYINQTKKILFNIWEKTRTTRPIEIETRIKSSKRSDHSEIEKTRHYIMKRISIFQDFKEKKVNYSEKDVLEKFKTTKKIPLSKNKDYSKIIARYFGTAAFSIIHPPKELNLPDFIIGVWDFNAKSTFGESDLMHVYLPSNEANNNSFNIAAIIQNNPSSYEFRKNVFRGTKMIEYIHLVNKEKFNVITKGNTQFVGWTFPIKLLSSKYVIPPSCVLFEGYGKVESGELTTRFPYGRRYEAVHNTFDAFTSYFHSSSKSSGPGTEAYISREFLLTAYPK